MSLADNPTAMAAALEEFRRAPMRYTMMDINQGPGEGNYDRIQELALKDAIRAAEVVGVDEQDTLVMKKPPPSEGGSK